MQLVIAYAIGAFSLAALVGLLAYLEHRHHRADRAGGWVFDILIGLATAGAGALVGALILEVLSWR